MSMFRTFAAAVACAGGMMWAGMAASAEVLGQCHDVATRCKASGGTPQECRRQVDECMSKHACEEVYLSCLELMEADETVTENACEQKRNACRKRYGQ